MQLNYNMNIENLKSS